MQGLQVFNSYGMPVLTVSDRITKILGSVRVSNGNPGSITVPTVPTNQLFYTFIPDNMDLVGYYELPPTMDHFTIETHVAGLANWIFPSFSVNGNVISWIYTWFITPNGRFSVNGNLIYGSF